LELLIFKNYSDFCSDFSEIVTIFAIGKHTVIFGTRTNIRGSVQDIGSGFPLNEIKR